jgi:hypothetical protein
MNRSIRWLLAESKVSSLDPSIVNFDASTNKLICYHLTSHQKWAQYNERVTDQLNKPTRTGEERTVSQDDSRSQRILKNLHNKNRVATVTKNDVEEQVISDMIGDPYTDSSGFNPGGGAYHGVGLYTCYKFNPSIAQTYGNICLVFEIDISRFLILTEDLAKQVHGKNWSIKNQILKMFSLNNETSVVHKSTDVLRKMLDEINVDDFKLNKTLDEEKIITAKISKIIMKKFERENIINLYDGIILYGGSDGPVCASFLPKHDAKLIGLGRLDSKNSDFVDWYDSLNDFVGSKSRNKLDFETMNNIAEENYSLEEKNKEKKKIRGVIDLNSIYILKEISLKNIRVALLSIQKLNEEDKISFLRSFASKFLLGMSNSVIESDHPRGNAEALYEILSMVIEKIDSSKYKPSSFTNFLCSNYLSFQARIISNVFFSIALKGYRDLFEDVNQSKYQLLNAYQRAFRYILRKRNKIEEKWEVEFEKVLKDYSWVNIITQGELAPVIYEYANVNEEMKSRIIKYCYHSSPTIFNHNEYDKEENRSGSIEQEFKNSANDFIDKSVDFVGNLSTYFARTNLLTNFILLCKYSNFNIEFGSGTVEKLVNIFTELYEDFDIDNKPSAASDIFPISSTLYKYTTKYTVSEDTSLYINDIYTSLIDNSKQKFQKIHSKIINKSIHYKTLSKLLGAIFLCGWDPNKEFDLCRPIFLEMTKKEKTTFLEDVINATQQFENLRSKEVYSRFVNVVEEFKIELGDEKVKKLIDVLSKNSLVNELERTISRSNISKELYLYGIDKLISNNNKLFVYDDLAYSINLYRIMSESSEAIEMLVEVPITNFVKLVIGILIQSFQKEVELKNSAHNLITSKVRLLDIISNDNESFYNRFIETFRSSSKISSYKNEIDRLEKFVKSPLTKLMTPKLDLSHRVLLGRTLKELYCK